MKKKLQQFFSIKKGTATGISLGFSAGILAVSLGTVSLVGNTVQTNKNVENSTVSYFSAERGIEYSLLDISGHSSGYEVAEGEEKGSLKSRTQEAKTQISIESRSIPKDGQIIIPLQGRGSSSIDSKWNSLPAGQSVTIPLYVDNTGK